MAQPVGRRWIDLCDSGSGVYRLVALDNNVELIPAAINRVCGVDLTGTLYIGHATSLRARLTAKLKKRFPPQRLAITWQRIDILQRRNREMRLLQNYLRRFGELPPMNSQA
jgi:hypothetical protein